MINPLFMPRFLICSFFLFLLLPVTAQEDKKAKDILDKLSEKTRSFSSIRTEFSYSLENKDKKINTSQEWKLMLKGDMYRLDMGDQLIISDGKTMWKYFKNDKEVEVSDTPKGEDALNPKSIFTMYEKGFKYKYVKEEKLGAKAVHVIDLFPLNPKEKDYNSIRLFVDKVTLQMLKSQIKAKNGNIYTYLIKKFVTNEAMDVKQFSFKAADFPGVEVNDLR